MVLFGDPVSTGAAFALALAIGLALAFEFVNGFHDTANAVATVIYTNSLKPTTAVVWSGFCNLCGALVSSGAVAFGIIALLPTELILNIGSAAGFAMVFAMLISAILWNLGTWFFGLPASSSHTLIGSIMGVGLANSWLVQGRMFGEGVNWAKAKEVGLSLLVSPMFGFCAAGLLLLTARMLIKHPELYQPAHPDKLPPGWIRGTLIMTCTGVSFAHGSNDGQKGMGLVMLILVGLLPGAYAINSNLNSQDVTALQTQAGKARGALEARYGGMRLEQADAERELSAFLKPGGAANERTYAALLALSGSLESHLAGRSEVNTLPSEKRRELRSEIYLVSESLGKLSKAGGQLPEGFDWKAYRGHLDLFTKFIPMWVKLAVALSLGIGTMIGWKRIVVTVGEKIGKEHLSYAQGASAELVAMTTIGLADVFGLPVSTTHVLSSGVAGTMAANRSGLQMKTLRNLLLAWVLTLPVCVTMGAGLFALGLNLLLSWGMR
ncbi:MAG: inorganic phosphate transporter [Bryobacterales bacterium]|nr:inorganic phosphate transporter [Bryobacterales bacterium]